jgi:hypothetical protein
LVRKARNLNAVQISEHEYEVNSESDPSIVYKVYSDIEKCSCPEGIGGKFCKHMCAVHIKFKVTMAHCPDLTNKDKKDLAVLALGSGNVDLSFYESMDLEMEPKITLHDQHSPSTFASSSTTTTPQKQLNKLWKVMKKQRRRKY